MRNIMFVHSSSDLYGSDKSLLNIVKYIDKNKYKVHVILPSEGPLVEKLKGIDGIRIEIFNIAILRRKNFSIKGIFQYLNDLHSSIKFLKRYIKSNNIDIVDTNTAVVFPGAIAAKRMRKKSVWHIREIIKNNFENLIISKIMNRYSDVIVANSLATGNSLKVDRKKVRVVYNSVESTNIEKLDRTCKNNIVGMAGRINRWKGQKLFVDAAEIVHRSMPEIVFQIAGDAYSGEDYIRQELIQYIKDKKLEDVVLLVGRINDMSAFYKKIDVFVLPSIQPEPFGLVIIEAMDYELPVIATNHGGPVEIITDGKDGYLVDFESANQMAERIIELMSNDEKRIRFGINGKEKKKKNYEVEVMVMNIQKIFDELY